MALMVESDKESRLRIKICKPMIGQIKGSQKCKLHAFCMCVRVCVCIMNIVRALNVRNGQKFDEYQLRLN